MTSPVAGGIDLLDVGLRSMCDVFRRTASMTNGGEIRRSGPVEMIASGTALREFNVSFVFGDVEDAGEALDEIAAFYDERGVSYRVVVPFAHAASVVTEAQRRSMRPVIFEGMTATPIPTAPVPAEVEIRRVTDAASMRVFSTVASEGFGRPPREMDPINGPWLLDEPNLTFFVAFVDGEPAATSLVCITDEIAGIYGVATAERFRRRGIGAAMTAAALQEGARRGCTIGALQPSDLGRPVYERLGFRASALFLQFAHPPLPLS